MQLLHTALKMKRASASIQYYLTLHRWGTAPPQGDTGTLCRYKRHGGK